MNDIEAWGGRKSAYGGFRPSLADIRQEAHYEPNAEWACKCDDCTGLNEDQLFDVDYWETNSD